MPQHDGIIRLDGSFNLPAYPYKVQHTSTSTRIKSSEQLDLYTKQHGCLQLNHHQRLRNR